MTSRDAQKPALAFLPFDLEVTGKEDIPAQYSYRIQVDDQMACTLLDEGTDISIDDLLEKTAGDEICFDKQTPPTGRRCPY